MKKKLSDLRLFNQNNLVVWRKIYIFALPNEINRIINKLKQIEL